MNILGSGFVYDLEYRRPDGTLGWAEQVGNLVPQQGVDFVAGLLGAAVALVPQWYLGVYENDYIPSADTTAGHLVTTVGESSAYDGSRKPWVQAYDGIGRLDNASNRAEFVFTADKRIYGAFLTSVPTKLDTSGVVLSIARFVSPRDVEVGGTLRVLGGLDLVPTN